MRSNSERELVWIVSICPVEYDPDLPIMPWKEIYKGMGEACQISSLEPMTQYQIKMEARIRADSDSGAAAVHLWKYSTHTTLPKAPAFPPHVSEWFVGASMGKVRLVGKHLQSVHSSHLLPEGCQYVFELYMRDSVMKKQRSSAAASSSSSSRLETSDIGEGGELRVSIAGEEMEGDRSNGTDTRGGLSAYNAFDELFTSRDSAFQGSFQPVECAEGDVDHSIPLPDNEDENCSKGWEIVNRGRCGNLNAVVSISRFRNPVLWLRVRVMNQEGMFSQPSPPLVFKLSNL